MVDKTRNKKPKRLQFPKQLYDENKQKGRLVVLFIITGFSLTQELFIIYPLDAIIPTNPISG